MKIIERIDKGFAYIGVLQTLIIAYQFIKVWGFADLNDAYIVYQLTVLMGFEFIMLHSGVVMCVIPRKYSLFVFCPIYALFAWGFSWYLPDQDYTIWILYLTTVLNRMRFTFFKVDEKMKQREIGNSIVGAIIYLLLMIFVVVLMELIPMFALDESFIQSSQYKAIMKAKGIFPEKPYVAICFGFLYYLSLSLVNFVGIRYENNLIKNKEYERQIT